MVMTNLENTPLLLHVCCAPCAAGCVERLLETGREIRLYYSNSNIATGEEFERRLASVEQLAGIFDLKLEVDPYRHADWEQSIAGYEAEPERGLRCPLCFGWSLGRTAERAARLGAHFATTLTVSPHKPSRVIFEIPYSGAFCKIRGGEAVNAVCAYACAEGELREDLLKKHGLSGKDGKIESFGKSAHGSYPELGKNAILPLLAYLKDCGENVEGLLRVFADQTISSVGNETGSATLSPNVIAQKDGKLLLTADFRVPAKMRAEEFFPLFDALGVKYTFIKGRDPLYVPKNSEYVQKLAAAYNAVTGENAQPISQRGATFASVFENGTAFGPEFTGEDCRIHAPNEFVPAKNLEKMYAIYLAGLKSIVL